MQSKFIPKFGYNATRNGLNKGSFNDIHKNVKPSVDYIISTIKAELYKAAVIHCVRFKAQW